MNCGAISIRPLRGLLTNSSMPCIVCVRAQTEMRFPNQITPDVIETEQENERMLKVIEKLMDKGEALSPEEEKVLKLLTRLVEDFEEEYYHPRDATPLEVLHHLMESRETKQTHLWDVFGSKGIASEVLNGKRGISKTHARALADYFHVPADLFI
jgi:HTH-type transcriptional regulator/antitoxin HigA